MDAYTSRSHWPDGHWIVSLSQFCDENGRLPQDGQYVPQCVIDRLAAYEETGLTPEELKALVLPLLSGDFRTPSMKKEDENAAKYFLYKLGRELKNTP